MPRTKGSKNHAKTDFDAQIAKLQKDKAMLDEGLSKTVAQIEELKTDIKSLRESLKPQKAEIKQTEKEIAKLEAKKAAAEARLPKLLRRLKPKLC
jgi:peptidoglycan hydrolase CwlO-like protein